MKQLFTKIIVVLLAVSTYSACKPFRDPNGISDLKGGEGDNTGRFVPKSREVQRNEVEIVLDQMEAVAKENASKAISSGDPARIDAAMAEWMSIRHQRDLMRALDPQKNAQLYAELGMNADAVSGMREGVLDSDKGKMKEYKRLLFEESVRSDKLYDSLRLDEKGKVKAEVIGELRTILKEMGFQGKSLLNSQTTNAEFRQLMAEKPAMQGYLHDLPGLVDAVELRENGIISKERFRERIKANLFHNGPDAGFWGKLKSFIFNDAPLVKKMFDRTVFLDNAGKLTYPGSKSVGGVLHRMADRISQATRGGLLKIVYETRFLASNRSLAELSLQSPVQTVEQLQVTKSDIAQLAQERIISQQQADVLIKKTGEAISRVENHGKYMAAKIKGSGEIASRLDDFKFTPEILQVVDESGTIETVDNSDRKGKAYVPEEILVELVERGDAPSQKLYEQLTDPNIIDKGLQTFDRAAVEIESKGQIGDPMRPISERHLATQNLIERSIVQTNERTRQAQAQAQEARNAAAEALRNRFNSSARQSANQVAEVTNQGRQLTIIDVMNVENFTRRPGTQAVQRLKFTYKTQIDADVELKKQFQELELAARQHEQIREELRSGRTRTVEAARSYRATLARVAEIRTRVINRIRAKAVRVR